MKWCRASALVFLCVLQSAWAVQPTAKSVETDVIWVSGLTPMQRRANAPRLEVFEPTAPAVQQRLRGVSNPIPPDLMNLAQQGPWYIPLFRPGSTGPYDIRQLHSAPNMK